MHTHPLNVNFLNLFIVTMVMEFFSECTCTIHMGKPHWDSSIYLTSYTYTQSSKQTLDGYNNPAYAFTYNSLHIIGTYETYTSKQTRQISNSCNQKYWNYILPIPPPPLKKIFC